MFHYFSDSSGKPTDLSVFAYRRRGEGVLGSHISVVSERM